MPRPKKFKNVYYCFIDADTSKTECLFDGNVTVIEGIDVIEQMQIKKNSIVYINLISIIANQIYQGGKKKIVNKPDGRTHIITYTYNDIRFVSIEALTLYSSCRKFIEPLMTDGMSFTEGMRAYVENITDPHNIDSGLPKYITAEFYADIKDELWEIIKQNNEYYSKPEAYVLARTGNARGHMIGEPVYATNVLMRDKKSAYSSVMMSDNMFPIGRFRYVMKPDKWYLKNLVERYIKEKIWFKIVIDYKIDGYEDYYDEYRDATAFDYSIILYLMQKNELYELLDGLEYDGKVHIGWCNEIGYLADCFRNQLSNYYTIKETSKDGSVEKSVAKMINNIIYGKGLTPITRDIPDCPTKAQIYHHYLGRGDLYIHPEMSLHVVSELQRQLRTACDENITYYSDTDGIKVVDTPEARAWFDAENERIIKQNIEAGFEDDISRYIGTWKDEGHADELLVFSGKRYIIRCGETYDITWSGLSEKYKRSVIEKIREICKENGLIELVNKHHTITFPFDEICYNTETKKLEKYIRVEKVDFYGTKKESS